MMIQPRPCVDREAIVDNFPRSFAECSVNKECIYAPDSPVYCGSDHCVLYQNSTKSSTQRFRHSRTSLHDNPSSPPPGADTQEV